jgi:hypothetical protein
MRPIIPMKPIIPGTRLLAILGALALSASASAMDGMHHHAMAGMLGPYPMTREGSGTSWQPEASPMAGMHLMSGGWMVMLHGFADLAYDRQGGPRGGDKLIVPSMFMAMGQRALGAGTFGVRTMLSLDPAMGKSGYPLLLQTGETADGATPLVDRQHPHDLVMELAVAYSVPVGDGSVFGYVGWPGEPALGPAAFMHRPSGADLPEAPLTHHWLDSTHVTFGVVTLGAIAGRWKLEASAFNGREPDELRWNIETRSFDSWSGRISFNPDDSWAMQASYGYLASPELLEPEVSVRRTTVSVSNTQRFGDARWSTTLAAGINHEEGRSFPGYLLESTWHFASPYSVFGRAEQLRTRHLFDAPSALAGADLGVAKVSLGGARELGQAGPLQFALGVLGSAYAIPAAARASYGSNPVSFMVFLQARLAGR